MPGRRAWSLCVMLGLTAPALLAFKLPKSATFFNQAVALIGWGGLLPVLAVDAPPRRQRDNAGLSTLLLAALALLLPHYSPPRSEPVCRGRWRCRVLA